MIEYLVTDELGTPSSYFADALKILDCGAVIGLQYVPKGQRDGESPWEMLWAISAGRWSQIIRKTPT